MARKRKRKKSQKKREFQELCELEVYESMLQDPIYLKQEEMWAELYAWELGLQALDSGDGEEAEQVVRDIPGQLLLPEMGGLVKSSEKRPKSEEHLEDWQLTLTDFDEIPF